jgi:Icc-related predicted phosphoesterase
VLLLGDLNSSRLTELRELKCAKFGVYGNHCHSPYIPALGGAELHRHGQRWRGLTFAGLNGCPRYKDACDYLYEQEDVARFLKPYPRVDVFLSHCPPSGVNDDPSRRSHSGWMALREYVLRTHPKVLLHGHTSPREDELITHLGNTKIIYVHGTRVIDIDVPGYMEPI